MEAPREVPRSPYKFRIRQSWGISSARHTSGSVVFPRQDHALSSVEHQFDVPVGPSVVRWCVRTRSPILQFQAHQDLITCMRWSPNGRHVVTTSYSGEIKLWSGEGWKCEDVTRASMTQQHHLAWSPDGSSFVIVGNGFASAIAMYALTEGDSFEMELLWQAQAADTCEQQMTQEEQPSYSGERNVVASENSTHTAGIKSSRDFNYVDAFTMAEVNPSLNIFAVKESQNGQVSTHLFSAKGELVKSVNTGEKSVALLSRYNSKVGGYGMVVQGGCVLILSAETLKVKNKFKVGYSSRSCVWDGENLVLPSDTGKLVWWNMSGDRLFEAHLESPDFIVHIDWSVSGSALWMCGFSALTYVEVEKKSNGRVGSAEAVMSVHCYDITCCGVAFSDRGQWLCAGDMAGGVSVMQGSNRKATYNCSVGASVRCLHWWGESRVLIGCLDGRVCDWNIEEQNVKEMCRIRGSVIVIRSNHIRKLLAIGSSSGLLTVYDILGDAFPIPVISFTAHPPLQGNKDMRFGQLSKQAEIWSLCWSPSDSQLATCSEDQTTKIWHTDNWTCQMTLCGHTMAVTSVDWREMSSGHTLLATCSDDRTIRVMDGNTFDVIWVLSTHDLYGWHTLTYLVLHPSTSSTSVSRPLLTCTTQHGYVIVWDTHSGDRMACGRIHCGSVEGLTWNNSTGALATVGSDCIVHLFELNI